MSDISDAYDALVTRLGAVLPTHKRLYDAYSIEENSERALVKGYAVGFGAGENTFRSFSCQLSVKRDFSVTLTRRVIAREGATTKRADAEKLLFEDQKLVIADIEGDPSLGNSSVIAKADWVSDNGLEFVHGDKDNYLKLESTVSIEYFEQL